MFLRKKLEKFSLKSFHRKLGDFKKVPEMLGFDIEFPALHAKAKFRHLMKKYCKKSALKLSAGN